MNMVVTLQCQPRLSSITNVAPGGSANQITVIKLNYSKIQRVSTGIRFSLESVFYLCLKHALLQEQIPAM